MMVKLEIHKLCAFIKSVTVPKSEQEFLLWYLIVRKVGSRLIFGLKVR